MFNKAMSHELSQSKSVVLKGGGFSAVADAMHVAPAFLIRLTVKLQGHARRRSDHTEPLPVKYKL